MIYGLAAMCKKTERNQFTEMPDEKWEFQRKPGEISKKPQRISKRSADIEACPNGHELHVVNALGFKRRFLKRKAAFPFWKRFPKRNLPLCVIGTRWSENHLSSILATMI